MNEYPSNAAVGRCFHCGELTVINATTGQCASCAAASNAFKSAGKQSESK